MTFWELTRPRFDSDLQDQYVNGFLEHPFGLPGLECDVCRQTWAGSRILALECPPALRREKHVRDRWPIPLSDHRILQRKVLAAVEAQGKPAPASLRPGDRFQPCFLDVPSHPRVDFLWSCMGSVVVSQRVRGWLDSMRIADVAFCPVTLRRIGALEPHMPAPTTRKPESLITKVPLLDDVRGVEPYFELLVQTESAPPPGGEPESICRGCGREAINAQRRKLVMTPAMWRGQALFQLATTLRLIATDELKCMLERNRATNVAFVPQPER